MTSSSTMKCVVCGSTDCSSAPAVVTPFIAERVYDRTTFGTRLLTCRSCGFGFFELRYSDEEMRRLYIDYRGPEYVRQRNKFEPWYTDKLNNSLFQDKAMIARRQAALLAVLDRYRPGLSASCMAVLDYGGDDGKVVDGIMPQAEKYVYDISNTPVKPGLHVAPEAGSVSYDLIICSNVLEHTPFPHETFKDIDRHAKTGSVVYIEVPLERPDGLPLVARRSAQQAWLLAARPAAFFATFGRGMLRHLHEHVNFWTTASMEKLFASAGYDDVSVFVENISGQDYVCGFGRK
jgi:Methyltransferase domain